VTTAWGAGQAGGPLGSIWFTAIAAIGVILAAVYILYMFQAMFLGPVTKKVNERLKDLSVRELAIIIPLLVLIFWIGLQLLNQALAPIDPAAGGVAYAAHIGGFAAGLVLILLFRKHRRRSHFRYS